jgi:hypothetical protein
MLVERSHHHDLMEGMLCAPRPHSTQTLLNAAHVFPQTLGQSTSNAMDDDWDDIDWGAVDR